MNKIFIVIASGGQYEDRWEHNVVACLTEGEAIKRVDDYKLDHLRRIKDFDHFLKVDEARRELSPVVEHNKSIDVPKWAAGISKGDITPEMRDERNKIQAQNDEIKKRRITANQAARQVDIKLRKDFFMTLLYDANDSIMSQDVERDTKYDYEEIKVV